MHLRPHEYLIVWKEAHRLCLLVYEISKRFPAEEKFALQNQIRRASYSVPTNIAEGNAKRTLPDKRKFIGISIASLEEVHYQMLLARDLRYISDETFLDVDKQVQRVSYLLMRFRQSLWR